jgi:hypothetical protein
MHHMDPAMPGHQSSSGGLLPAFNGNTKPLKTPGFGCAFVPRNSMQGCDEKRVDAAGKRINE